MESLVRDGKRMWAGQTDLDSGDICSLRMSTLAALGEGCVMAVCLELLKQLRTEDPLMDVLTETGRSQPSELLLIRPGQESHESKGRLLVPS